MSKLYSFDDLINSNDVFDLPPMDFATSEMAIGSKIIRLTNANIYARGKVWWSMPYDIHDAYSSKCGADAYLRAKMGTEDETKALEQKRKCDAKYKQVLQNTHREDSQSTHREDIWRNTYCCITCGTELTDDELVCQALCRVNYTGGDPTEMGWSTAEICNNCMYATR